MYEISKPFTFFLVETQRQLGASALETFLHTSNRSLYPQRDFIKPKNETSCTKFPNLFTFSLVRTQQWPGAFSGCISKYTRNCTYQNGPFFILKYTFYFCSGVGFRCTQVHWDMAV